MGKARVLVVAMLCLTGNAFAEVLYSVDFDSRLETLNDVKPTDGKIRFGGQNPSVYSVNTNEWAGKVGDPATTTARVNIVDDGTGSNNLFHLNGVAGKSVGGVLVLAPEVFGGSSFVANMDFDVKAFNRKASDGSDGYLVIYQATGYDLSGATDQKIILQLVKNLTTGVPVTGVNGSAQAVKLAEQAFNEVHMDSTVSLGFNYDGSSAVIAVWESRNKTEFKFDSVVLSDDGVETLRGDPSVVMFGGLVGVFDNVTTNNAFVSQLNAGSMVQFNGVNSEGGSFGASGSLKNREVGASLTNAENNLVMTTEAISSSNLSRINTVTSGGQLGIHAADGAANFQQSDETSWSFSFNKQVEMKHVVFSGLDANAKDRMRITIEGTDYDLSPYNTEETDTWSGSGNTEVYSFTEPISVPAGSHITLAAHDGQSTVDPVNNKWGLYGLVVEAISFFETLNIIDFGGNPDLFTNALYQAEIMSDATVDWWGGDDVGHSLGDVGTLKDQGVGGSLSAVSYGLTLTSRLITSSNAARTNTVVSNGQLGVNFYGSAEALFESVDSTAWSFFFNKDVYLGKVLFKGLTGSTEEAQIIIGSETNSVTITDLVDASFETGGIYTFSEAIFIESGTTVTVQCPNGKWGLGSLVVGVDTAAAFTAADYYAQWLAQYPSLGSATNYNSDADNDGYGNLYEYALGGDPTAPGLGANQSYGPYNVNGIKYFQYVQFQRVDAALRGLSYSLLVTDDLVYPRWTNGIYEVVGSGSSDGFNTVTNHVRLEDHSRLFWRLIITM